MSTIKEIREAWAAIVSRGTKHVACVSFSERMGAGEVTCHPRMRRGLLTGRGQ